MIKKTVRSKVYNAEVKLNSTFLAMTRFSLAELVRLSVSNAEALKTIEQKLKEKAEAIALYENKARSKGRFDKTDQRYVALLKEYNLLFEMFLEAEEKQLYII